MRKKVLNTSKSNKVAKKIASRLKIIPVLVVLALSLPGLNPAHAQPMTNKDWWPEKLNLQALRQHSSESNPMGDNFKYAEAFKTLDLEAVKKDIKAVLTKSQDWWPADYGNYGPFFIRMAWHSAGTYRTIDGRGGGDGGQQRFEPLNSWPDNANLDKARRLLWSVKKKYGRKISWADLMVLTGNVSLESMGFKSIGFAGGRVDQWEPDLVFWGPENKMLADERHSGNRELQKPLGAVQMGLIYVNPEGPNGNPDPLAAAKDIRQNFGRMAMNDEETVALIAGGHTFGKAHGAHKPSDCVDVEPAAAGIEEQGMGWKSKCGKGNAEDTITSGLEGAWSVNPVLWTTQYFDNLFAFDWVKTKSPAGAIQWIPANGQASNLVPDAHIASKRHAPIMFTTDIALKFDPSYKKISKRFHDDSKEFERAFASAWFKLTHRDMGPRARYLGADVPKQVFSWQDPVPAVNHQLIDANDTIQIKSDILKSGLTPPELIRTAWASASTFRNTDMRGGANGSRIRLQPQKNWEVNDQKEITKVISKMEVIQKKFNESKSSVKKKVSIADLIVLGGDAAIEQAAKKAGYNVKVSFKAGRTDASQEQTDINSFALMEPTSDGFRNFYSYKSRLSPTEMLVDKADTLGLTVPEMTVLVGGMRVLNANAGNSVNGVFTNKSGTLTNDFFVNLLDISTKWSKSSKSEGLYEGHDRKSNKVKWTATPVDLIFGSNSELRAISEFYASEDSKQQFVSDFAAAWSKVMQLDRF